MTTNEAQEKALNTKKVMISSTARDLPNHRDLVKEGCLRQGMLPIMMEHLPASDSDAVAESLRMVDEATIYLGIFAHRYGHIPKGHSLSITEMEYNRAVERGIPRLIFLMHEDHPLKAADVEKGEGALKLEALKARLQTERVVNVFKSPAELQAQVINSLSHHRQPNFTAFHYISDIPQPPTPYIAHPYTLLQTPNLIGRQNELNLLTDWVAKPGSDIYNARILNVIAIGGMGKSALTWKWFNDIAPYEIQPLAGRIWWSFYESDASFEHFVTRSLAYVSKRPREEVQVLNPLDRESQLLSMLDREPYLVVLDGLERILLAYARLDASRLSDDDLDQQTANQVAGALGLPKSAAQSFTGQHRLRKIIDPRVGNFLRKLTQLHASRILISSRLYPADLQTDTGHERAGSKALFLRGLSDEDALNLWRAFGVRGSRSTLLPLFQTFDFHPLLIRALAGVVTRDRRTPGDFDVWHANNPDFDPFRLPLVQAHSHILATAFNGLSPAAQEILYTIAAFRMPTSYDTLVALFVGEEKQYMWEDQLVDVLTELEDRGLLGWDRRANRYDLHPIVRGVTWSNLAKPTQQTIYATLNGYFDSFTEVDEDKVKSIDDLAGAIELYYTFIGLERFKEAWDLLEEHLLSLMIGDLGAEFQVKIMGEALFTREFTKGPLLDDPRDQSVICYIMAMCSVDQVDQAVGWCRKSIDYVLRSNNDHKQYIMSLSYSGLAEQLCFSGAIYLAEIAAANTLISAHLDKNGDAKRFGLIFLSFTLAIRGRMSECEQAFKQSIVLQSSVVSGNTSSYETYALAVLWNGQFSYSSALAQKAEVFYSQEARYKRRSIRSRWIHGLAALALGQLQKAEEYLHQALLQARSLNQIGEEIPARIWFAELRRRQGNIEAAREMLDEVWERAERGSFRLYLADAYNVLAQIEYDAGNITSAITAANKAYERAWCDGPPFAYHWGLQKAKAMLATLNAPEPQLPPFDPTGREPIPHVEIVPSEETE